jgi:ribonuclease T1
MLSVWLLASCDVDAQRAPGALPEVASAELPPQARETIALIRKGGPYRYERDGIVFGNFEKRLPLKERGYYREYTVRTPGSKDRGARRIVAGRGGELYYTDDHYNSFRRIKEP